MHTNWHGAWAAIPTPFDNGNRVDTEALRQHIRFLCHEKIDGLVVCATTGEGATLSDDEKLRVIEVSLSEAGGMVPIIAGVGTNDTRTTLDNARRAKQAGVDGLLIVTPYYNKPNQEGLYRHFMAVADGVDLPQILYNVPGRTGVSCLPKTLGRLSAHPNIVGIKDATGDMVIASQTRMEAKKEFLLFSGDDGTTLPFIAIGGVGAISVVANVAPRLMHDLIADAHAGHYERAREKHECMLPLFASLFSDTSPIPLKAILHKSRLQYPIYLRAPLYAMDEPEIEALVATIKPFIEAI